MTTVGPAAARFNIIRKWTRGRMTQRSRRKVSAEAVSDVSEQPKKETTGNAGFCGESFADNGELLSSLSPLLFSMKLFGLYFHRQERRPRPTDDPELNPVSTTTTSTPSIWPRISATIVLILVWLNAVRFVFVFTATDQFGAKLLREIMFFSWFGLIAVMYTACYVACHTGKLLKVLKTIRVTQDCVTRVRRCALALTALCWISVAIDAIGGAFLIFSHREYDFLFTPFYSHLPAPRDKIAIIVKVIGFIGMLYTFPSIFFSHAMNAIMVYVFYSQYKKVKRHFRRALGEEGRFNGDLSIFRRRHRFKRIRQRSPTAVHKRCMEYPHFVDVTRL